MPWWAWALVGLGALLLLVVFLGILVRGQMKLGMDEMEKIASEILDRSDSLIWAELFHGPSVEGARKLPKEYLEKAREDLAAEVRIQVFKTRKAWRESMGLGWMDMTHTEQTMAENSVLKAQEILLARAWFAGYQLGLNFGLKDLWGPWQANMALAKKHTQQDYTEKRSTLVRWHPWVEPLSLRWTKTRYQTMATGQDTLGAAQTTLEDGLKECLLLGLLRGMAEADAGGVAEDNSPVQMPSSNGKHA